MKLLLRSSLYKLALAVPLVLVGTVIGYYMVRAVVTHEVDEQLEYEAQLIARDLSNGVPMDRRTANDSYITVRPGTGNVLMKDTVMPDAEDDGELKPWRIGNFPAHDANGAACTITVGRSLLETEDLVAGIAASMTLLIALVMLVSLLLDLWLSRKLWKPFHASLAALENFRVDANEAPHMPDTNTTEFTTMNRSLQRMMERSRTDFTAQKRFTEQAAHELRTPLAVMQGKLDQLIQSPNIGEQDAATIDSIYRTGHRMNRTVTNMLLLARIGNQQFPPAPVDWERVFSEQHHGLEELISSRNIRFNSHVEEPCRIELHPLLADLVAGNLLRNAVLHNVAHGHVEVVLRARSITITNSGAPLSVPPESLFARFTKGDPSSPSAGLGLSIVKEIVDGAGLQLSYRVTDGVHTIVVTKP